MDGGDDYESQLDAAGEGIHSSASTKALNDVDVAPTFELWSHQTIAKQNFVKESFEPISKFVKPTQTKTTTPENNENDRQVPGLKIFNNLALSAVKHWRRRRVKMKISKRKKKN